MGTIISKICGNVDPIEQPSQSAINHNQAREGTVYNYWATRAWGANLGNWLVLEKWMNPEFFQKHAPKAKDEWTFCQEASNPAALLQEHWETWITEDDFRMLAGVKANHVRIPVGYWAFIDLEPDEPYISQGQKRQLERILGYCNTYDIYAVIDLHGLPGSQNGNDHSGHAGQIGFYSEKNLKRSLTTVKSVVDWVNQLNPSLKRRIASIEVANEPTVSNPYQLKKLRNYYQKAFSIVDASPFKIPMMFHDAFQGLGAWKDFLLPPANAVIDIHPYYAFPPVKDTHQIIRQLRDSKTSVGQFHLPVVFGEWSLASGVADSNDWLKQMMDSQVSVCKSSGGAGGIFWSLKNRIHSKVWSFELLVKEGIIDSKTFSNHSHAQC